MSRVLLFVFPIIFLVVFPSQVLGHAKLVSPAPWNANPSKTQVCGVNAGQANPSSFKITSLDPNQLLTVQWTVVVGDGVGPLSARIDPTAKVNPGLNDFSIPLQSVGANNPNAVRNTPYTITFQIPANTVCTGPRSTCTLRVTSTSNWVACATIVLGPLTTQAPPTPKPTNPPTPKPTNPPTANPPTTSTSTSTPAPTSPPTSEPTDEPVPVITDKFATNPSATNPCVMASGLTTCSSVNGQNVQLMGPSLAILDAAVGDDITFGLTNSAVLITPNTPGCAQAFTALRCAMTFPPCLSDVPTICSSTCQSVTNLCSPNATLYTDGTSHAQLYDCTNTKLGFTATVNDTTGACPNVATAPPTQPPTQPSPAKQNQNHADSVHSNIIVLSLTIVLAFLARL